jgi:hypothetical protein
MRAQLIFDATVTIAYHWRRYKHRCFLKKLAAEKKAKEDLEKRQRKKSIKPVN